MVERMIFAGSGGQGMMTLGKLVAEGGMRQNLNVTYFPSYGSEVRGGTAHCHVVVTDGPIYSPMVDRSTALVIMNQPSLDRFLDRLASDGLLVLNTTMAKAPRNNNIRVLPIRASSLANDKIGNIRAANMIMLGALLGIKEIIPPDVICELMEKKLAGKSVSLIDMNRRAIRLGAEIAKEARRGW